MDQQILERLTAIFQEVFTKYDLKISETSDATEIDEWDSLQHIILILSIEKEFKIKFTAEESQKFNNVRELIEAIKTKL